MGSMKSTVDSARRRLFLTAGAALSAPLVVNAAGADGDEPSLAARLVALEDANAIRRLNGELARHLSAGADERLAALFAEPRAARLEQAIRSFVPDPSAGDDVVEIAGGGARAEARLPCIAEIEAPIEPVCPLVEMARAQGGGVVRRSQRGVIEAAYVKRDGRWKIERLVFRAA
ncbi:MAG TPA: hypothetical protein VF322_10760 [Gammaproteobacteria bacterium]